MSIHLHHLSVFECPECVEKLKTAHKDLGKWFWLMKKYFSDMHICWAYRDKENQEEAFTSGKSHLHFPDSPHNKMDKEGNPCSLALDLFQLIDGKAIWPVSILSHINQYNALNHLPIKWGGQFKSLGDFDHFQLIFPF